MSLQWWMQAAKMLSINSMPMRGFGPLYPKNGAPNNENTSINESVKNFRPIQIKNQNDVQSWISTMKVLLTFNRSVVTHRISMSYVSERYESQGGSTRTQVLVCEYTIIKGSASEIITYTTHYIRKLLQPLHCVLGKTNTQK